MEKTAKKLLNGLSLGDGYISVKGNSYRLCITHCAKQKGYLEHKVKLLEEELGRKIPIMEFDNCGYKAFRIQLCHSYLKFVREWLYKNGKKKITLSFLRRLTDRSVALCYMDDGSLVAKKRNGKIHAYDLVISMYGSEQEASDAISFFNERYGIKMSLKRNKGLFSIRCGTKDARILLSILKEYSCKCMEYKFF